MLGFLLSGSLQKCFCFSPSGQAGSPRASLSAAPGSRLVMMAARGDTCRSQADRFLRTEPGQEAEPGSDSRPPPVTQTSLHLSWKRLRQQTLHPSEHSPTLRCQLASLSLYGHGHGQCAKCSGSLRPHAGDLPTGLTCLPRTCCEPAPHRLGFPPASPTKNPSHILTFCPDPREGGSSSLACTLSSLCALSGLIPDPALPETICGSGTLLSPSRPHLPLSSARFQLLHSEGPCRHSAQVPKEQSPGMFFCKTTPPPLLTSHLPFSEYGGSAPR